jgi:Xaa-Pro aminopeptidase
MRTESLLERLSATGADLMLLSDEINVRYLTGFTGDNAIVVVGPDTRLFVTDSRYTEQAAGEVDPSFEQLTAVDGLLVTALPLLPRGSLRLGFESEHVSYAQYRQISVHMPERVELVPVVDLVEGLRRIKDAGEIELMAAAAKIADDALAALLETGLAGRTERELAITLEHDMRLRGAEGPSFPSIVASGAHGALPHAVPRDVAVERGQLVTFDWGARYRGYCSDCTRTVAAGEPSAAAREAYELVLGAQLVGLGAVHAGASGREIDATVRKIIYGAGHSEHFGHGLGHGVGLEIHEAPRLSRLSGDTLEVGDAVTVEPGVYVPGEFGLRIEDHVVVEPDGIRILTPGVPKDLLIVD